VTPFRRTKHRFYLVAGLLLILFCGSYIQLALFFNRMAERSENRQAVSQIDKEIKEIKSAFWQLRFCERAVRNLHYPDAEKKFSAALKTVKQKSEALTKNKSDHQLSANIIRIATLIAEYENVYNRLSRTETDLNKINSIDDAVNNISAELITQCVEISSVVEKKSQLALSTDADLLHKVQPLIFLSFLVALFILLFLFDMIAFKIIAPIRQMSEVAMQVKSGNAQTRFESVEKDEIAELGFVFNEMLDDISEHRHQLESQMKKSTTEVLQTSEELILEIVERKQAEDDAEEAMREAEAANRAKSTFLANMSHELRTPLNAILGYAQILQRENYVNEYQRNGLKIIQKSGQHLLMLLNDILDLSKIEVGRMEIQPTEFHLEHFLNNIVDIFRLRSEQKKIRFNCVFASDLPTTIRGDEIRLRQVLINLLSNAVKFTEKGFVAFEAALSPRQDVKCAIENCNAGICIRFQVRDTGIGIAPEDLKIIFEPFQQANPKREHTEGTGLGLAISKKLMKMMGGRLEVKSKAGQGSLFIADVAFGITDSPASVHKAQHTFVTGYTGPQRTVLIADDNPENRSVLRYLLTPLKFEVIEACNGQEAVETMLTLHPDIILMDMVMPVSDGFEATRKIRSHESRMRQSPSSTDDLHVRTPIIAITARAFINDKQKCLAAGCDDFIPKPVNVDELLEKLQRLLSLEWLYKEVKSVTDEYENTASLQELPDPEDLKTLIQFAGVGDISSIRRYADKLEKSQPRLRPFVRQLNLLAQQFQIDKIRKLLNSYKGDT